MIELKHKIAILSHILPPAPSGQSMMLFRLLSEISADSYCLISREDYNQYKTDKHASNYLPARYYALRQPRKYRTRLSRFVINPIVNICSKAKQVRQIMKDEKCEMLIPFTGDLYDIPVAYLACLGTRVKFVPYIVDWYAYQWTGHRRIFSKFLEPFILKRADNVLVLNEFLKEEYKRRYSVESTVIRHPIPIPDLKKIDDMDKLFNEGDVNIVFTGAIYVAQIDAICNLISAINKTERKDIKLHIFTSMPRDHLEKNCIMGQMVIYHDHVNESEVARVLRNADILFLPLSFNSPYPEVIKTSAPTKMGEYMAVGKPVLVHAPKDSFLSWYFRNNQCGVVVDDDDADILASALINLIENKQLQNKLEEIGLEQAKNDFAMSKVQQQFADFVDSQF